jgi:cytochrome c oxidase cbb3-type subunit II
MKNLALLFCGIFAALACSFMGLILAGNIQLGSLMQTTETLDENGNNIEGDQLYPIKTTGFAKQGKEVYREMGCIYCHTQQVRRAGYGSDIDRGWGDRASVARDYILQDRVFLGTMRTGPDLMAVGNRPLNKDWHLIHLYNPREVSKGSTMPPYPFLFDKREIVGLQSANALKFAPGSEYAPEAGYEVVPTRRAEALVEYLLSLKLNYSLPEAPIPE